MQRLSLVRAFRARSAGALNGDARNSASGDRSPILDQRSLVRELELEVERAKRGSRRLSVLVGRLGGSDYDDATGRRAQDPLVERAAGVLVEHKRQIDTVAVLGQGKFVLILPETGEPGALIVAERLRAAVASAFRERDDAPRLNLGVASLGSHGRSANALLGAAERAVLAAKHLDHEQSLS